MFVRRWDRHILCIALASLLVSCGGSAPPPSMPPPEVGVVAVRAQSVPLTREAAGRLSATRVADVRARVAGVLQKRLYEEGSEVKEGQLLFQIDPAPLRAALAAAEAALEQAQANAINARVVAKRNRELAKKGLVSQAELDDAEANERSTAALVSQAKANVESARINLGYASVRAPISGRSGQQRVTEGALVGEGEATLLTTIEQIDPIYVNFDQPASEINRLRRAQASGDVKLVDRNKAQVEIIFQDGTPYPHAGTLDFADFSVNPTTGALAFRGTVPNPERLLLPGMYVNVRLTVGELNNAFLVPQAAVQRDGQGAFVLVAGKDGTVAMKRINTVAVNGTNWVVDVGLEDGDQIIVSGIQKARPGGKVKPVPYQPAEQTSGGPQAEPQTAVPTGAR